MPRTQRPLEERLGPNFPSPLYGVSQQDMGNLSYLRGRRGKDPILDAAVEGMKSVEDIFLELSPFTLRGYFSSMFRKLPLPNQYQKHMSNLENLLGGLDLHNKKDAKTMKRFKRYAKFFKAASELVDLVIPMWSFFETLCNEEEMYNGVMKKGLSPGVAKDPTPYLKSTGTESSQRFASLAMTTVLGSHSLVSLFQGNYLGATITGSLASCFAVASYVKYLDYNPPFFRTMREKARRTDKFIEQYARHLRRTTLE